MSEKNLIRVNARISKSANDWLDLRSEETGISKSALIMLAVEEYKTNKEVIERMSDIGSVMEKLEQLQSEMKDLSSGKPTK